MLSVFTVAVSEGKPAKIDFTLKSKPLAYEDATASEIIAALPGTDQQKVLFSQCSNCHTLQWALAVPRTKEDWVRVVKKMAGRAAEENLPGTYQFSQQQFIEPLAEYLTQIRGPGSSAKIPFKQRPRPSRLILANGGPSPKSRSLRCARSSLAAWPRVGPLFRALRNLMRQISTS